MIYWYGSPRREGRGGNEVQVRVLTGQAKGTRLKTPRRSGVRPTSSRVRSALFSILPPATVSGARVLDLYAGAGSLGIEALSRGAGWVDFVERDRRQCQTIRDNVATAGLRDRSHVFCVSAHKALTLVQGPYDLIVMDPPYQAEGVQGLLAQLAESGLLAEQATVVLEHAWRSGVIDAPPGLTLKETRRYGDTALTFYTQAGRP